MKAVSFKNYGNPEVLEYLEIETPEIQDDEILIQVHAAGVSPFDLHMREGWYKASKNYGPPIILGWEISGRIKKIGKDVREFKLDDEVFAHPSVYRAGGGYAEYVAVKANEAAHKPNSISHLEAAAASMNSLTAWQSLFDLGNLLPGQKILIHGASGGVGHLAVQLAKWKGAYVIGTASGKNKEFVLSLGADLVIDYKTEIFDQVIKDKNLVLDLVLDAIGGEVLERSFPLIKKSGMAISIIDFERINNAKNYGVRGENVIVSPNQAQLKQIADLLDQKILKPKIDSIFNLNDSKKAHERLEKGGVLGKVMIQVKE